MSFALDVAIAVRIGERLRRDVQHAIVKHVQNVDARQAAARVAGAGVIDDREQVAAILDRFAAQFVVGHRRLDVAYVSQPRYLPNASASTPAVCDAS